MKFRMVDRIVAWDGRKSIRGIKTVSYEEYQLQSSLGGERSLPAGLMMESLFQLGNWLIMRSSDFRVMGLLVRFQEVQFTNPLRPGQRMLMEVFVRRYRDDGVLFDGRGLVDGRVIVEGNGCLASPVKLEHYFDPEDMRVLFSELYHPIE